MTDRKALERGIAALISPVSRIWRALGDETLMSLNISNSEGWALVHLQRAEGPVRQNELARIIGIREASLVPTIARLEDTGMVVRETEPDDRRAKRVKLTRKGHALAQRIDDKLAGLRTELLDGIGDDELKALTAALDRIYARLNQKTGRS